MNNLPIKKHEWVEKVIQSDVSTNRIYFPNEKNIRGVKLRDLEIFNSSIILTGLNGERLLSLFALQQSWVTLINYSGKIIVDRRQTTRFFPDQIAFNISPRYPRDFVGQEINWPASYIDFEPFLRTPVKSVLAFSVYYEDNNPVELASIIEEIKNTKD